MTYTPALINDFRQLKTFFTGEKELAELNRMPIKELVRPKGYLYFNRWQVTWIIVTAPLAIIAHIFLKALSILLWSNRLDLWAKRTIRHLDYLQSQWKYGSAFWVASDNEYRTDLQDVFDLPSVERKAILDPLIRTKLNPELKRVNYNRIGKGTCWGSCFWFNFLVLKKLAQSSLNLETAVRDGKVMQDFDLESFPTGGSHSQTVKGRPVGKDSGSKDCVNLPSPTAVSRLNIEQILVAVAKLFEDGQPRQAALLQSFYGLECDLLDVTLTPLQKTARDGVYVYYSDVHSISFIKWGGRTFVWDARDGLIAIKNQKMLETIVEETQGKNADSKNLYLTNLIH